jgi:hypothetical protein
MYGYSNPSQPKIEPLSVLGFSPQTLLPPLTFENAMPTTTAISNRTHHHTLHHQPSLFIMTYLEQSQRTIGE